MQSALAQEEVQFGKTLDQGLIILNKHLKDSWENNILPGEVVFQLFDTFGLPVDITRDIALEKGITPLIWTPLKNI